MSATVTSSQDGYTRRLQISYSIAAELFAKNGISRAQLTICITSLNCSLDTFGISEPLPYDCGQRRGGIFVYRVLGHWRLSRAFVEKWGRFYAGRDLIDCGLLLAYRGYHPRIRLLDRTNVREIQSRFCVVLTFVGLHRLLGSDSFSIISVFGSIPTATRFSIPGCGLSTTLS
ncbi:hypothetical protein BDN72DRAFT_906379 [Pluteus cervinus]|uniref:Uncharacterized protein n=1 Tax=Pluteus cervinus TaxID=181527 RepID=A0ACD3A095_9AGAR|nr:hypothetical protein BDN72DRAFT_906379 [Pluteus cervinus]